MQEIRDVKRYEKYYSVSSDGIIYSKRKTMRTVDKENFSLRMRDNGRGYLTVMLYDGEKHNVEYVHRIVAETFIPNPNGYKQVNHKDENKRNNKASNLEWCDAKYNINYGTHIARSTESNSRAIVQLSKDGTVIKEYKSAMEASRKTGISQGSISHCCNKERKYAGGYMWMYLAHAATRILMALEMEEEENERNKTDV